MDKNNDVYYVYKPPFVHALWELYKVIGVTPAGRYKLQDVKSPKIKILCNASSILLKNGYPVSLNPTGHNFYKSFSQCNPEDVYQYNEELLKKISDENDEQDKIRQGKIDVIKKLNLDLKFNQIGNFVNSFFVNVPVWNKDNRFKNYDNYDGIESLLVVFSKNDDKFYFAFWQKQYLMFTRTHREDNNASFEDQVYGIIVDLVRIIQ